MITTTTSTIIITMAMTTRYPKLYMIVLCVCMCECVYLSYSLFNQPQRDIRNFAMWIMKINICFTSFECVYTKCTNKQLFVRLAMVSIRFDSNWIVSCRVMDWLYYGVNTSFLLFSIFFWIKLSPPYYFSLICRFISSYSGKANNYQARDR